MKIPDIEIRDVFPENFYQNENIICEMIYVAIENAERHGTPLIVKENGVVKEVLPADFRKKLLQH